MAAAARVWFWGGCTQSDTQHTPSAAPPPDAAGLPFGRRKKARSALKQPGEDVPRGRPAAGSAAALPSPAVAPFARPNADNRDTLRSVLYCCACSPPCTHVPQPRSLKAA